MKYTNENLEHIAEAMNLMDEAVDMIQERFIESGYDEEMQITMVFEILMNAAAFYATRFIADDKKAIVDGFELLYELHSSDDQYATKN
jgi:hypothetical protein